MFFSFLVQPYNSIPLTISARSSYEKILEKRIRGDKVDYLVKRENLPDGYHVYVSKEHLLAHCPELLNAFEEEQVLVFLL